MARVLLLDCSGGDGGALPERPTLPSPPFPPGARSPQVTTVRTATGPGGISGPLRIDLRQAALDYSVAEADAAFQRTQAAHGWAPQRPRAQPPQQQQQQQQQQKQPPSLAVPAPARSARLQALAPRPPPLLAGLPPPQPPRNKRPASPVVIDLLLEDSEGEEQAAERKAAASRSRRCRAPPRAVEVDLTSAEDTLPPPTLAQRLALANESTGLDLLPPPAHWRVGSDDELLRGVPQFVALPLPGGSGAAAIDEEAVTELVTNGMSRVEAITALADVAGDVDAALLAALAAKTNAVEDAAVAELQHNGLSRREAVAALQHACGDTLQALLWATERRSTGQPIVAAAAAGCAPTQRGKPEDRERARREQAELAEAEAVLARFEAHNGMQRSRVLHIERVQVRWGRGGGGRGGEGSATGQSALTLRCLTTPARPAHPQNLELHTHFDRRRRKVALAAGGNANVMQLWHGADQETLATICCEGFDHRRACRGAKREKVRLLDALAGARRPPPPSPARPSDSQGQQPDRRARSWQLLCAGQQLLGCLQRNAHAQCRHAPASAPTGALGHAGSGAGHCRPFGAFSPGAAHAPSPCLCRGRQGHAAVRRRARAAGRGGFRVPPPPRRR